MKPIKRAVRRNLIKPISKKAGEWRGDLLEATPERARRPVERFIDYLDMMFVDHGIFRMIYSNRHKVSDDVWRSSQPWPYQIGFFAKNGVRTVVNLRGGQQNRGGYRLIREACDRHGLNFVEFKLKSRDAPCPEDIGRFEAFFRELEHPILIHCKSGADRVGFASALYLFLVKGEPLEIAQKQLHARFGHFKHAYSGILDYFFERYSEYARDNPIPFQEWVETVYRPAELKETFRAGFWSSVLADKILRRE